MKKTQVVIAGLAALSMTATVVAAQNGGIGRTIEAVQSVLGLNSGQAVARNAGEGSTGMSAVDFRWAGRVAEGSSVEVKGINGEVTMSLASGSEVVVTAEATGRRSSPESVRVELVEHAEGLTFCAVYPTPEGKRENECGPRDEGRMSTENNDVNVHFHVEVPAGVSVIGRTVNGGVEMVGLESDAEAYTVNGSVHISTSRFAVAETVNGSIEATLGAAALPGDVEFSTVNGDITLDLVDGIGADLDASWLNGDFESDLPFTLEGRLTKRSVRGALGSGGPDLAVSTVNGSVRIR